MKPPAFSVFPGHKSCRSSRHECEHWRPAAV